MKTFNVTVHTSFGHGLDKIKAKDLQSAHEKATKKFKEKLISTWCPETGEEIFKNSEL